MPEHRCVFDIASMTLVGQADLSFLKLDQASVTPQTNTRTRKVQPRPCFPKVWLKLQVPTYVYNFKLPLASDDFAKAEVSKGRV
jgi:uncharacterized protein (DUF952 family)